MVVQCRFLVGIFSAICALMAGSCKELSESEVRSALVGTYMADRRCTRESLVLRDSAYVHTFFRDGVEIVNRGRWRLVDLSGYSNIEFSDWDEFCSVDDIRPKNTALLCRYIIDGENAILYWGEDPAPFSFYKKL